MSGDALFTLQEYCSCNIFPSRLLQQFIRDTFQQWRLVVKLAGRAAKFHLWLNIWSIS